MKKYLLLFVFAFISITIYSQELHLAPTILKEYGTPNREIPMDSVYNFMRSASLDLYGENNWMYFVDQTPITYKELTLNFNMESRPGPLWNFLNSLMDEYIGNIPKEERKIEKLGVWKFVNADIISLESYAELFATAWDSTTTYVPNIGEWEVSKIGDNWFTEKQFKIIYELQKRCKCYPKGIIDFELSLPIFDKSFNFAFIMMRYDSKSRTHPILYKREVDGWKRIKWSN